MLYEPTFQISGYAALHFRMPTIMQNRVPEVKFPHRTFVILTFTGKLVLATHVYELAPNFYALDPLATTTRFETPNWAATWLVPNMVHNLTMSVLLIGFGRV